MKGTTAAELVVLRLVDQGEVIVTEVAVHRFDGTIEVRACLQCFEGAFESENVAGGGLVGLTYRELRDQLVIRTGAAGKR